jgi:cobalamin biosynthesis protein CbiG
MGTDNKAEVKSQKSKVSKRPEDKSARRRDARPSIYYITRSGHELAERIAHKYPRAEIEKFGMHAFSEKWKTSKSIICIMAAGIVVRAVAPLVEDKKKDPAVVVLDEKGRYAISLLSGHMGGANHLATEIAEYIGAQAVITTASDVQGKLSLDLWAMEKNLYVDDFEKLKKLSSRIVNGQKITLKSDCPLQAGHIPDEFTIVKSAGDADMIISERIINKDALFLRPGNLFAGIGCNRGTAKEEIAEVFNAVLLEEMLSVHSVKGLASIDLKKDEEGLLNFAHDAGLSIEFYSKDDLNSAAHDYNIKASRAVKAATGAIAVAEPAAVLGAMKIRNNVKIIKPKEKRGNVTLALAKAELSL